MALSSDPKTHHGLFLYRLKTDNGGAYTKLKLPFVEHPNCIQVGHVYVSLSDTQRDHKTDRRRRRHVEGAVYLELIYNPAPETWGQGLASKALTYLCQQADVYQMELRVLPAPYRLSVLGGLDAIILSKWFTRYGFNITDGLYMCRKPLIA